MAPRQHHARRARAAIRRRSRRLALTSRGSRARSARVPIELARGELITRAGRASGPLLMISRARARRFRVLELSLRACLSLPRPRPRPLLSSINRVIVRAHGSGGLFPCSRAVPTDWERTNPAKSETYAGCSHVPKERLLAMRSRARGNRDSRAHVWSYEYTWEHGNIELKLLKRLNNHVPKRGNSLGNMGTSIAPALSPGAGVVLAFRAIERRLE